MSISGLLVTHCTSIESYDAGAVAPAEPRRRRRIAANCRAGRRRPARRVGAGQHTDALQMTPQALQRTTWTVGLGRARRALPSLCGTVRFLSNMYQ